MHVLVVTWDGGGNLPPFRALVQELVHRQHQVTIMSESSGRKGWKEEPVRFRPWGSDVEVIRSRKMMEADRVELLRQRLWLGPASANEFKDVAVDERFDAYVIDHSLRSCAAVVEALDLPAAGLYHGCRRSPRLIPSPVQPGLPLLNEVRSEFGLPPLAGVLDSWDFARIRIVCSARAYDAPHLPPEPADVYVGPIIPVRASRPAPVIPGSGPLVVVSFSTTWMSQIEALQVTIDGLAPLGLRVLVTAGPGIDLSELRVAPPVVATSFVAHQDLLPVTDVVVTHAGHGTVMASLRAGVPLVCLPMGRDQFGNADLVVECGAGLRVTSAAEVPAAVRRILTETSYRTAARRMAVEIEREPGASAAADAVESLVRSV